MDTGLLQKNPENSVFQPAAFASRSLSDAEPIYSQTEREVLAVVFSCERFKNYVYGLRFTVVIDHKPLLKLYPPSCSGQPTRIHWWPLRLQKFDFELEYERGLNNIADILSRKPFFDTPKVNEAEHFVMLFQTPYLKLFMKFERQPKTIRFSLRFEMQ